MFCMGLPIFDIVNGFLNRCRGGIVDAGRQTFGCELGGEYHHINQIDYLAEIILRTIARRQALCRPVVDGVDSQA
jgi:hypothetical protein